MGYASNDGGMEVQAPGEEGLMKTMVLVIAFACFFQEKDPESARVTLDCKDMAVSDILAQIQSKTGIPVIMDEEARKLLDPSTKKTLLVQDIRLRSALSLLFVPYGLTIRLTDKKCFLVTTQY
jgi:hypothetical protein